MAAGIFPIPMPQNEPVFQYKSGSPEKKALKAALQDARKNPVEVPLYIGGETIYTGNKKPLIIPHDLQNNLGYYHEGDFSHVELAINAAKGAKSAWEQMPWHQRAAIFLKAADLLTGPYRYKMNAATMLGQSKTPHQSEIEAVCELADFLRFNVYYMGRIYGEQPLHPAPKDVWNTMEYRPLEGFVFAVTPFNFTAIAGNLPTAPAMMGNTVLWKPSESQIYAAHVFMEILKEAGLPEGVVNLINVDGPEAGKVIFAHSDFAGFHFTGSTTVFQQIWQQISQQIENYKSYPRIVGETGGKDFIIAHKSANPKALATAITRGAFEYQGQKCSAVSRVYIPMNIWEDVKAYLLNDIGRIKVGDVEDFRNFMGAVITERAFDKITGYIDTAKKNDLVEVLAGGDYDKSKGYFIQPTILVTKDPQSITMEEEIFGPVVTIYVYQTERYEEALELVNDTSPYGLTGAVFSKDRHAINLAHQKLQHAAGNFYVNDKPTGSIVGQQPFGGARKSGTNDKAGFQSNLMRWVSPRSVKENFNPPEDFKYPFMDEK